MIVETQSKQSVLHVIAQLVIGMIVGIVPTTAQGRDLCLVPTAGGPHYLTIPMDPTFAYAGVGTGSSVDSSGNRIGYGGSSIGDLVFLDRSTGARKDLEVLLGNSISQQLVGSGSYYLFDGFLRSEFGQLSRQIVRLQVDSREMDGAPASNPVLFRSDRSGNRLAMMQTPGGVDTASQYFLYDFQARMSTQLTDWPDAIDIDPERPRCVRPTGATPLITADGGRVLVITPSTLGLSDEPWEEGACNVLEYSAPAARWRRVATLPPDMIVDLPVIDDAGTLLSFVATRPFGDGGRRTVPYLLSVESGALIGLPDALYTEAGFDSVVSRDGSKLVVSSRADLDPRGGNSDHNMEVFTLNLATMIFDEVTFSTGGIGSRPGGCESFQPSASDDASVLAFGTPIYTVGLCQLDGPMRDERTGMVLGQVRSVLRRPGNQPPALTWTGSTTIAVDANMVLRLDGHDADGDPLTFWAQARNSDDLFLPAGSTLTQDGPVSATLRWQPSADQKGPHDFRLALFDEGGDVVTTDVHVMVCGAVFDAPCRAGAIPALFGRPAGSCGGDVNGDGAVSAADLVAVARRYQTCVPEAS